MRLKTLNGAPLCQHLDFTSDSLLEPEAVAQFIYEDAHLGYSFSVERVSASPLKWRRLGPADTRLRTGWSQPYLPTGGLRGSQSDLSFTLAGLEEATDMSPNDTTNMDTTLILPTPSIGMVDFVQHSLIFHDTLLSSQVAGEGEADRTVSSSSFMGASFETTSSEADIHSGDNSESPIVQVPPSLQLTSLASLPGPAQLRSIYPQTPTPNILCVLAAAPEDKDVMVRKGGYRMSLRELTVADETKVGFKVTFWSRPSGGESHKALDKTLDQVRVGDILLLRNIALNTFRDNIYGQSLNPSITRVKSTIDILMSSSGMSSRQLNALPATIAASFSRVRRWGNAHVAPDRKRKADAEAPNNFTKRVLRSSSAHSETLPPDTMESI